MYRSDAEDLKNQYKEGIEEGINLGQKEIVLHMLHSGNSPEQIAQLTGIDVEVVKQWIEKGDSSGCAGEA